ncbi:MAG: DUF2855 family protein [Pseudomonadota bacterium]
MQTCQLEVHRTQIANTRLTDIDLPPAQQGEITVAVDRFALTANNITYAVVGEKIGYWKFFPVADGDYGVVPVWGFANVVESRHDDIAVGERLYGYWPMGTHLRMMPGRVSDARFFDTASHRAELPPVYNAYARCTHEPHYDAKLDDARMLLFPLYATSFCLYDFLIANDFFGAEQVIIPSASSKTSVGLAFGLAGDAGKRAVVGLTSASNVATVESMGFYDSVFSYDDLESIDTSRPTVIVDMSGNGVVLSRLHELLGDNMRYTSNVGLTHYQDNQMGEHFIRERSAMFFAPGHMQQRNKEWGPGEFEKRSYQFWLDATKATASWLSYRHLTGMELTQAAYREVLSGEARPDVGLILSPSG